MSEVLSLREKLIQGDSTIRRLKSGDPVSTITLDALCRINLFCAYFTYL